MVSIATYAEISAVKIFRIAFRNIESGERGFKVCNWRDERQLMWGEG